MKRSAASASAAADAHARKKRSVYSLSLGNRSSLFVLRKLPLYPPYSKLGAGTEDEDDLAAAQRHLSRRLRSAAESRNSAAAVIVRLRAHKHRVRLVTQTRRSLDRAHTLAALAAQLQVALAQPQAAHSLRPRALARVRRQLDAAVVRAARLRSAEKRVQLLSRELQTLATRALAIPVRKTTVEQQQQLEDERRRPLLTLAPHQWVPPTLWRIYESVEHESRRRRSDDDSSDSDDDESSSAPAPRRELRECMRALIERMRDLNPYSCLHVLFQPPPASAGESERRWLVTQNDQVARVADSLRPPLTRLHQLAFWLESPRHPDESVASCEREFDSLIRMVRDVSAHFHYVLLFLYSVAMGRADANVTANSVLRQVATHSLGRDVRGEYGINTTLALADPLLRQSYAFFPEVLVFLDEWRHDESMRAYGFASNEVVAECVVDLARRERKDQRVLAEIAEYLKDIFHTWRRSRLGSYTFKSMDIHELGTLEKLVKSRLRSVMDLLYKQNVAAWVRRRQTNWEHRILHDVRLIAPKQPPVEVVEQEKEKEEQLHSISSAAAGLSPASALSNENADPQQPQQFEPQRSEDTPRIVGEEQLAVKIDHGRKEQPTNQSREEQQPADEKDRSAADSGDSHADAPTDGSLRRRRHHPKNCGRFRAPGVLSMKAHSKKHSAVKKTRSSSQVALSAEKNGNLKIARLAGERETSKASADKPTSLPKITSPESLSSRSPRYREPVLLEDIYAWSDAEIDANEQETEHIYELQEQLQTLREKVSLEAILQEVNATWLTRNLPKRPRRGLSLLESSHRLLLLTRAAVRDAETIALHGAAEALICQPSLRETESASEDAAVAVAVSDQEDGGASPAKLQELRSTIGSTRHLVAEMLKSYRGEQSSAWGCHLAFFAQATKGLLEIASESVQVQSSFVTTDDEDDDEDEDDDDTEHSAARNPNGLVISSLDLPDPSGARLSASEHGERIKIVA